MTYLLMGGNRFPMQNGKPVFISEAAWRKCCCGSSSSSSSSSGSSASGSSSGSDSDGSWNDPDPTCPCCTNDAPPHVEVTFDQPTYPDALCDVFAGRSFSVPYKGCALGLRHYELSWWQQVGPLYCYQFFVRAILCESGASAGYWVSHGVATCGSPYGPEPSRDEQWSYSGTLNCAAGNLGFTYANGRVPCSYTLTDCTMSW